MTKRASPEQAAKAAFGKASRADLLDHYFATSGEVTTANAWRHVYRLLLWIDRTTGLAHCYESDKSQPGRAWYARTLTFHDWLCGQFENVAAGELGASIDWMFAQASARMAAIVQASAPRRKAAAHRQRLPYQGRGFPEPGLDPDLTAIVIEQIGQWFTTVPPKDALARLTTKIHEYMRAENKRRNLLGEGFEDVLSRIITMVARKKLNITTRALLTEIGGFNPPRGKDKQKRVDVAIVDDRQHRSLVTAKWSIRADREEQFASDYERYVSLENLRLPFDHVVVTNEFDPARLIAACDNMSGAHPLFTSVVHVSPAAVLAVYGETLDGSQAIVAERIATGRLMSLERWLETW